MISINFYAIIALFLKNKIISDINLKLIIIFKNFKIHH